MRANLAPLGIEVRIVKFEDPYAEAQKPGVAYDALLSGWFLDWPDPSEVLNVFLDPGGYRPVWAPQVIPIPPSYRHRLARAALLQGEARVAAYRRLAVGLARDVAPFAAYATPVLPEFLSARVGCRLEQPVIGAVDLGTLCVRE